MRLLYVLTAAVLALSGCTDDKPADKPDQLEVSTPATPTASPVKTSDGVDPVLRTRAETALPTPPPGKLVWRGVEPSSGAVNADQSARGPLALQAACVGTGETVTLVLRGSGPAVKTVVLCTTDGGRAALRATGSTAGVTAEAHGRPDGAGVLVWQLVRTA